MLLRTCRDIDAISSYISDPVTLASLLLVRDRRSKGILSAALSSLPKIVTSIANGAQEDVVIYMKFSFGGNTYRLFTVRGIVVAVIQEDASGHVTGYGVEVLNNIANTVSRSSAIPTSISVYVEEIPLRSITDQFIVEHIKKCAESVEKMHLAIWRKRGVYWLSIEDLISDKGSYTYVFRARDAEGNVYALKIPKEDIAVDRSFTDIVRGYINVLAIRSIDGEELRELLEMKGYSGAELSELALYRDFLTNVYAVIVPRDRLDRDTYISHPPVVVEEYMDMGDLEEYVKKRGALGLEESMYILIRITGAVALAHLMNSIHMDIKPRNILMKRDAGSRYGYTPKITDFSGAIGDPGHGYRLARLTPAYADPVALMKGYSDLSYDVYSLAMVFGYMISGTVPKHRLALNIALLQNVYGYPIPMEKIGSDEAALKEFVEEVVELSAQLKTRSITVQEFVKSISKDLEALDGMYMTWLNSIPRTVADIVRRSISLNKEERYKSCVDMWLDLRRSIVREGMENTLPKTQ